MSKPSALILDRDGTIVAMSLNPQGEQDSPYFATQLELYPALGSLLRPWVNGGIPIFVVTNQPGMAKGQFVQSDMEDFHAAMKTALGREGITIQGIFACTHHPVGKPAGMKELIRECGCRKPKAGLLFQVRDLHGIDLSQATMVGDSEVDIQAAKTAGLKSSFLVRTFVSASVPSEKRKIAYPKAPTFEAVMQSAELWA